MIILEAVIAILIVFSAILLLNSQTTPKLEKDLTEDLLPILEEIAQDIDMRSRILSYDTSEGANQVINGEFTPGGTNGKVLEDIKDNFIAPIVKNPSFSFDVRICDFDKVCPRDPFPNDAEEIFSAERVISIRLDDPIGTFSPKKVKIFLWERVN